MQEDELLQMLTKIDEKLDLAKDGLLLYTELQETQREAELLLERVIEQDTRLWREFDSQKTTTYWSKYPKGKYTNETGRLQLWREFIVKTLNEIGVEENKKQQLINKGQYYTARKTVREILQQATNTIDIQDNYSDLELLNILEEYVSNNPHIKIRILMQKINNTFKSDLQAFTKQYGSILEIKTHANCHDRFIFIDSKMVYHSGHSFKDLGNKVSLISLVGDDTERKKLINEFEEWWNTGSGA